ncbi:MAG: ATP-binding cassette domain-containing protein [Planctomycetota bacterium]|nr:ATP-binding cassette domain-containing protein [Planctomycetota bacterium]
MAQLIPTARPGLAAGLAGRSGSGKSILAKPIQRLYVPEAGRVLVDGVDLALVDTARLRRNIGVVPWENFLFIRALRDSARRNLRRVFCSFGQI